jgi:hypothetical protein
MIMRKPSGIKLEQKLQSKFGPALARLESLNAAKIWSRLFIGLIFVNTTGWWLCRLYHPQFLRFRFWETACLDIMLVGPFANLALLLVLFVSVVRSEWEGSDWSLYAALFCGLSPWVLWFLGKGLLGTTGLDFG